MEFNQCINIETFFSSSYSPPSPHSAHFLTFKDINTSGLDRKYRRSEAHLRQFESRTVKRMLHQLLNRRQQQVVILLQEDLVAVALLHFTSHRSDAKEKNVASVFEL